MNSNITPTMRIFHWLIAISIVIIMATIIMRETWFEKHALADKMYTYTTKLLQDIGQQEAATKLQKDDFIKLAKSIRNTMWNLHVYTGYFLMAIYAIRLGLLFSGKLTLLNPLSQKGTKNKFKAAVYLTFYICLGCSLLTGVIMVNGPESLGEPLESVHVLSKYYVMPFIIIHFAGLIIAEYTDQKGIAGKMISSAD